MIEKSFYFNTAILTPRIKFWLLNFSRNFQPRFQQTFSFRKSISRFSSNLSSSMPIKLLTLKKIESKIFFKNFIFNLFTNDTWVSFSQKDMLEVSLRNITNLKKKLTQIFWELNINYEVILTTNFTNKIFKNFIYKVSNNFTNNSFFFEKYFLKQKCSRAVSVSNSLKFLLMKFFTFFTYSFSVMKKLQMLTNKRLNTHIFNNFLNFKNIFLSNRIFIFLILDFKTINISSSSTFFTEIYKNIKILESYFFLNGFISCYSIQKFNYSKEIFLKSKDFNFIKFFVDYTGFNKTTQFFYSQHNELFQFDDFYFKNKLNFNYFFNKFTNISILNNFFNFFKTVIFLLQLRISLIFLNSINFFLFFLKCQLLHN